MILVLVPILIIGTISFVTTGTETTKNDSLNMETPKQMLSSLEDHYPIYIAGDIAFEIQAQAESWPGDGSSGTPYVIQNYHITNDTFDCIYIEDVSLHFEIRNCLVTGTTHSMSGIELDNVTNCYVADCHIYNQNAGLRIVNSVGVIVENVTSDDTAAAASIENSNYTTLIECIFSNTTTGSGLVVDGAHWTSVFNCDIISNNDYGVEVRNTHDFLINGSEIADNGYGGKRKSVFVNE